MKKYSYEAQTPAGSNYGVIEASSKKAALNELLQRGYLVSELKRLKKFGNKDFWNFMDALQALLDQNTTLSVALHILASSKNGAISKISTQLNEELSDGVDFIYALDNVFKNLDPAITALLRVGYENSGLEKSLEKIIIAKQQKNELVIETQKAIAYPCFVLSVSIIVLVIIFDSVLPEFKNLITKDAQSGLATFIMSFAGKGYESLLNLIWFFICTLCLIVLLRSTKRCRRVFEEFLSHIPIVGRLLRTKTKLTFLENISLALLLKSDLKTAIQFSVQATNNQYYKSLLSKLEDEILEGASFEGALERTGLFDRMELLRISLAEKTAKLPETFQSLLEANLRSRQKWINLAIQLLGPFSIIILGLIIFFVAFAIVTPMMSLQQAVG